MSTSKGRASASRMATCSRGSRAPPAAIPGASLEAGAASSSSFCGEKKGSSRAPHRCYRPGGARWAASHLGQSLSCLHNLPAKPAASCCDNGHVALHTLFLLQQEQYLGGNTKYPHPRGQRPSHTGQGPGDSRYQWIASVPLGSKPPHVHTVGGAGHRKGTHLA